MPATGPNSGPTTMAPTMRIGVLSRMPTAAMSPASTMKIAKFQFSSAVSDVRDATSSQTTASDGDPSACLTARSISLESWKSTSVTEIEPTSSTFRPRRSARITDASSRARSTSTTSPSGRTAAPAMWTMLQAEPSSSSIRSTSSARSPGTTIRTWNMGV